MSYVRKADVVNKLITDFPDLWYDGVKIQCKVCKKSLMCWDKSDCTKHVSTIEHRNRKKGLPSKAQFLFDLLFMMIACNLSLRLLEVEQFQNFWNKYNPELKLPTTKTARKHIPYVHEEVESKIKSELTNQPLWLCIEETTDCKQNSIVNVIVRVLDPRKPTFPLLLASKRLQECTDAAITRMVLNTLKRFQLSKSQVLMFMTDNDATLREVGRSLQEHGWKFLHVTCKLHALHIVAEAIQKCFPKVDALIASTKKVFLNSPKRIQEFHRQCPDIPIPTQPILTHWGTWLKAAVYYFQHFQEIKSLVLQFDPKQATAIKESQAKFQDAQVEADLQIIYNSYKGLHDAIEKLQNSALSVVESLQIIDEVNTLLYAADGAKTSRVLERFESILAKDFDFATLRQICDGASTHPLTRYKEYFNYACITSVDVEGYKHIFSPQRTLFHESTAETYLMVSMFCKSHSVCDNTDNDASTSDVR